MAGQPIDRIGAWLMLMLCLAASTLFTVPLA
jgi:hypothetical protein